MQHGQYLDESSVNLAHKSPNRNTQRPITPMKEMMQSLKNRYENAKTPEQFARAQKGRRSPLIGGQKQHQSANKNSTQLRKVSYMKAMQQNQPSNNGQNTARKSEANMFSRTKSQSSISVNTVSKRNTQVKKTLQQLGDNRALSKNDGGLSSRTKSYIGHDTAQKKPTPLHGLKFQELQKKYSPPGRENHGSQNKMLVNFTHASKYTKEVKSKQQLVSAMPKHINLDLRSPDPLVKQYQSNQTVDLEQAFDQFESHKNLFSGVK